MAKPSGIADSTRASRQVTRHWVRDYIMHKILSGHYPAGAKLVQQGLSEELGVSRGVVREAIFELQGTGLVNTEDNRGASVGTAWKDFLLEALELRESLEGIVAARCCDRITRAQLRDLREMVHEEYKFCTSGRRSEASQLDRQFHLRLMEIAGNNLLIRLSQGFWFVSKVVGEATHNPKQTLNSHLEVLKAVESGDPELAKRAMQAHLREARAQIEEALTDHRDSVKWVVESAFDDFS